MVLTYAEEVLGYIGGSLMAMGKGGPKPQIHVCAQHKTTFELRQFFVISHILQLSREKILVTLTKNG